MSVLWGCFDLYVENCISATGGVFSRTEMSEVLTEIVKMDPSFDREEFVKECQYDIIPNVLEVGAWCKV